MYKRSQCSQCFFEWCVNYSSLTGWTADSAMATSTASADSVTTKSSTRLSAMSWVADSWTETQRARCRCSDVECSPELPNNIKIVPETRFYLFDFGYRGFILFYQSLGNLVRQQTVPCQYLAQQMQMWPNANLNLTEQLKFYFLVERKPLIKHCKTKTLTRVSLRKIKS